MNKMCSRHNLMASDAKKFCMHPPWRKSPFKISPPIMPLLGSNTQTSTHKRVPISWTKHAPYADLPPSFGLIVAKYTPYHASYNSCPCIMLVIMAANKFCTTNKQEGHDGPVSLHWLIREIHSYQTLHYLGIGLKHKTPYMD